MDELEQRLTRVLTAASERADPSAANLRNPATSSRATRPHSRAGRARAAWVVGMAALTVTGVAVGMVAGIPQLTRHTEPAAPTTPAHSAGPVRGTAGGKSPLWPLGVAEGYAQTFAELPAGAAADPPVPFTVDPNLVPERATAPTLVTAAGTVRFDAADTAAVHLLAHRRQGLFIALTGRGHDGEDGLREVRFEVVAPDNSRRPFHRAAEAGSVTVSPDGTTLAVSTWLGDRSPGSQPAVELVDVRSGRVDHRLPGRFTQVAWASDTAVVLSGEPGEATSLAWRAPWTGPGERIAVRSGTAMTVAGGLVALDDTQGCLQRLDVSATVTAVNCATWRTAGHVSPDGRYVSLEWDGADGTRRYGFLDISRDQVRSWPVAGMNPAWLGGADVVLTQADGADNRAMARCDVTTGTCARLPGEAQSDRWRGAAWIGS